MADGRIVISAIGFVSRKILKYGGVWAKHCVEFADCILTVC